MRSSVHLRLIPVFLLSAGACGGSSNADSLTGDASDSDAASSTSVSGGSDETASEGDDATSGAESSGDGDGDGDGDTRACPGTDTPWSSGATQTWVVSQTSVGSSIPDALYPAVSADGRWVAYVSGYGLDGMLHEEQSLFIADNECGEISEGPEIGKVPLGIAISDDGSTVAYISRVPSTPIVEGYIYDVASDTTARFDVDPQGNPVEGELYHVSLSADGRYLAFDAASDELVPDDSNLSYDVFVRDLEAGTTERVSLRTDGNQLNGASEWPEISADGRKVIFASRASSISDSGSSVGTHLYLRDLDTKMTVALSPQAGLTSGQSSGFFGDISSDGRFVVFETDVAHLGTDTDDVNDVYLLDRMTDTLEHISADIVSGLCRFPRVSDDGDMVVFEITDEGDAAIHDRNANEITRIREHTMSESPGTISNTSISADGQWIVFLTQIKDIVDPPIPSGVQRNVIMLGTP